MYEEEILNEILQQLQEQLPKVQEFDYYVEDDVLVINSGKSGVALNQEELKDKILENVRNRKFDEEIQIPTYEILPKETNYFIKRKLLTRHQNCAIYFPCCYSQIRCTARIIHIICTKCG